MPIFLRLMLTFALTSFFSIQASTASAQYRGHYYVHTYFNRVPMGYGYFNYWRWPVGYWVNPYYNGFTYYPYYNYMPRFATYGALAYSVEKDQGGYAFGFTSRDDAANAAVSYCQGEDCKPVAWVQGGCLAMTTSKATGQIAWGYGDSKWQARSAAMQSCRKAGATDCEQRSFVCSY